METTQGIPLYSYLYLKLAKNAMFLLLSFKIFLLQNERKEGGISSAWRQRGGGRERGRRINAVQIMYTHVSKCKNDTC
jgi:hypothetical protein